MKRCATQLLCSLVVGAILLAGPNTATADPSLDLRPEKCREGIDAFRDRFHAYFYGLADQFAAKSQDDLYKIMRSKTKQRYELQFLATGMLPEGFPFKLRMMSCFVNLFDFDEALEAGKVAEATESMKLWSPCVPGLYEPEKPPRIVVRMVHDIAFCFETARKSHH